MRRCRIGLGRQEPDPNACVLERAVIHQCLNVFGRMLRRWPKGATAWHGTRMLPMLPLAQGTGILRVEDAALGQAGVFVCSFWRGVPVLMIAVLHKSGPPAMQPQTGWIAICVLIAMSRNERHLNALVPHIPSNPARVRCPGSPRLS